MTTQNLYNVLADIVLTIHALYAAFIIGGLILIIAGAVAGWSWVTSFWFRILHLIAIGVVTVQSWLQIVCPLTSLETILRERAGQLAYDKTFIAHWLHRLLYFEAPMWFFSLSYTLFGLAVVIVLIYVPPRQPRWRKSSTSKKEGRK